MYVFVCLCKENICVFEWDAFMYLDTPNLSRGRCTRKLRMHTYIHNTYAQTDYIFTSTHTYMYTFKHTYMYTFMCEQKHV